jgi:hypothetical protein
VFVSRYIFWCLEAAEGSLVLLRLLFWVLKLLIQGEKFQVASEGHGVSLFFGKFVEASVLLFKVADSG